MTVEEQEIAHEILAYLVEHPDAQDTLEGIAEWWLWERAIKQQTPRVKKALTSLVEQNLIIQDDRKGTPTLYQINHDKHQEILELLSQHKNKSKPGT